MTKLQWTTCPRCQRFDENACVYGTRGGGQWIIQCACGQPYEISFEEYKARSVPRPKESIHTHPRGWWFRWDTNPPTWCGSFPSAEEAEKTARLLIPDNQKEIELIELQMWAQKIVEVKK